MARARHVFARHGRDHFCGADIETPGRLYDVVFPIFAVAFGLAAPGAHITGFVLGIAAIFRRGDSRGLGILGVCLNSVAVAIGILLVWAAAAGLAVR